MSRTRYLIASLLVLLATLMAYAPGLAGPFLLDDFDAIHPLAASLDAGNSWSETLKQAPHHIRARVLSNVSFLLTQTLAGGASPKPFPYKLGNLLVHLWCAAVVGLLARRLTLRLGSDARRAAWTGLLAAAGFALHPLLVSTVLYPVQRMAQLATVFSLLAVWAYVGWREALHTLTNAQHIVRVSLILGLTLLAVLSKQNGALVPLLIGAAEITCFRWPAKATAERQRFETGFGLICAAPLVIGAIAFVLQWERMMQGYARREFDLWERLLTQLHVLTEYASQIVWPRVANMGLLRDDYPLTTSLDATTALLALAWLAAFVVALWLRRRASAAALALLWFLGAHALESSVLPLELVFEHRNYLAMFGPALAFGYYLSGWRRKRTAALLATAVVGALTVQTARRAIDWADYGRWIQAEARHHPESLRAGSDLVFFYLQNGQPAEAAYAIVALREHHEGRIQIPLLELALVCPRGKAQAIEALPAGLAERLGDGQVSKDAYHLFRGLLDLRAQGRCNGLGVGALTAAAGAVANNPGLAGNARAAAAWHRMHGRGLLQLHDWAGAASTFERALVQEDNDPRDWIALAHARIRLHDRAGYLDARSALARLLPPGTQREAALSELDAIATQGFTDAARDKDRD